MQLMSFTNFSLSNKMSPNSVAPSYSSYVSLIGCLSLSLVEVPKYQSRLVSTHTQYQVFKEPVLESIGAT